MNSVFNEQILADKLSKLNSTQQCIETLSHWCIFHRQKAEQVVQTWDKQFHSSDKEHKIPFLYLANDILQNSKRKGTEFVGEFWKVLPAALKDVYENGEDSGKTVVSRLVGIWEERKVFGSRAHGLSELMLGSEPLPNLELSSNKKRSRSIRILRRDSRSIKTKLSVGGTAEKIVSAFHTVLSENPNEDTDLKKCKDAVHRVGKMEKSVATTCSQCNVEVLQSRLLDHSKKILTGEPSDPRRATLIDKLQEDESLLRQCVDKLKSIETSREALVSHLKEALKQQESELENVRTQLQVAQAQIEEAANMQRRLKNEPIIPPSATTSPSKRSIDGGSKKTAAAIAAEVADRLAASTHSQQIMTSVLSSFAAEASKNAATPNTTNSVPKLAPEKLKHEKPMSVSNTAFLAAQPVTATTPQQYQTVLIQQSPMQGQVGSQQQPQYNLYQTPPQQYYQSSGGGVMIGVPYAYSTLPPPPPPVPQMTNFSRPQMAAAHQQQSMALIQQQPLPPPITLQQPLVVNQQPVPLNMQQPVPPSYRPLQPPGMAFYQHQSQ